MGGGGGVWVYGCVGGCVCVYVYVCVDMCVDVYVKMCVEMCGWIISVDMVPIKGPDPTVCVDVLDTILLLVIGF